MSARREYKNSLFTTLFNDPRRLVSLYNALTGSTLPPDTPLTIETLENVLFSGLRNDVAFLLGDVLIVLVEHQSTLCANMPLRILLYLARILERLVGKDDVYRQNLVRIPRPEFIVLYNGEAEFPAEGRLRLSDAFLEPPPGFRGLGGHLELEVRLLNINDGRNAELVERCLDLLGYVRIVRMIREKRASGVDLTEAVTRTVEECIEQGILAEFLREHSTEVINLLTEEWNLERALFIRHQEGRIEGHQEGRQEGSREGLEIGILVIKALKAGMSIADIAAKYQIPEETVRKYHSDLQ